MKDLGYVSISVSETIQLIIILICQIPHPIKFDASDPGSPVSVARKLKEKRMKKDPEHYKYREDLQGALNFRGLEMMETDQTEPKVDVMHCDVDKLTLLCLLIQVEPKSEPEDSGVAMGAEKLDRRYNIPSLPNSDDEVESDFRGYTQDLDATMAMSTMSDIVLPSSATKKAEADEEERRQLRRDELLAKGHDRIYEKKKKIFNAISGDDQLRNKNIAQKMKAKKAALKTTEKKAKMILENMKKEEKTPKPEKRAERQVDDPVLDDVYVNHVLLHLQAEGESETEMTTEVPESPDLPDLHSPMMFVDDSVYIREDSVQLKVGWDYIRLYKLTVCSPTLGTISNDAAGEESRD